MIKLKCKAIGLQLI